MSSDPVRIYSLTINSAGDPELNIPAQEAVLLFPNGYEPKSAENSGDRSPADALKEDLRDAFANIFGDDVKVVFDFEEPCPFCGGPPDCECVRTAEVKIHELVEAGHALHCAQRIVYGDGECECGRVYNAVHTIEQL